MPHRSVTPEGLELIKHHEGLRLKPYLDVAGKATIGYGHLIRPEEFFPPWRELTEAEAEDILRRDLYTAERAVLRMISVPLNDGQFNALVSFTFNLGGGALQASTLRRVVNRGDFDDAPAQFKRWVFAGGRKWPGLIRRRADEAAMFEFG